MYFVIWRDWMNNEHKKAYKNLSCAIKKCFAVHGWYKNGQVLTKDGEKIL